MAWFVVLTTVWMAGVPSVVEAAKGERSHNEHSTNASHSSSSWFSTDVLRRFLKEDREDVADQEELFDDALFCDKPDGSSLFTDDSVDCDESTFRWNLNLLNPEEPPGRCGSVNLQPGQSFTYNDDFIEPCLLWLRLHGNLQPTASPSSSSIDSPSAPSPSAPMASPSMPSVPTTDRTPSVMTGVPTTAAPVTDSPVTDAPVSTAPVSAAPVSVAPVVGSPVEGVVTSEAPVAPSAATPTWPTGTYDTQDDCGADKD